MADLSFVDKVQEATKDITSPEQVIGRGLVEPFNGANSGVRKLMFSTHLDHVFPLIGAEKAIIETGYEIRYGDYSSSITKADSNYRVIAKVSKFSFAPNHHYWLIVEDMNTHILDVVERISYHYITEQYGYLYNNEYMDSISPGDVIPAGTIIQKSLAYDEYNNRKDGINFNIAYMTLDDNMEDSIIFSDVAAGRLTSPLVKPVKIMINDNDIPLNIYGNEKTYKIIPDIGQDIRDANLIALRKEKKEEAYYNQSVDRLRTVIMSDEVRQTHGKVIDINIYCNNPEILESHYYGQLKMYYEELKRSANEIVSTLLPYTAQGYKLTYELQKLLKTMKLVNEGAQYSDKKAFSNIILEVVVLEELKMNTGDKASNRFGGKGVVSNIWPQEFMPRFKNHKGEYEFVDVIFNSSTMINRENVGQTFELSLTHIGSAILEKIKKENLSLDEAYKLIWTYVNFCSPEQAAYLEERRKTLTREEFAFFIESIVDSGAIHLSMKPISDSMSIDKLNEMYKAFPFVKQNTIEVAIRDSEGRPRYVKARRPIIIGKQYIYR